MHSRGAAAADGGAYAPARRDAATTKRRVLVECPRPTHNHAPTLPVKCWIFSTEDSSTRMEGSFFSVASTTPLVAARAGGWGGRVREDREQ
jgi:hypothetical protein